MPGTNGKRIALAGLRRIDGAKTTKSLDANVVHKPSVRQRDKARDTVAVQAADGETFTAPFDPAERHAPPTSISDAKRHNLQAAEEGEGLADEYESLDNLLDEGRDDIAESDI